MKNKVCKQIFGKNNNLLFRFLFATLCVIINTCVFWMLMFSSHPWLSNQHAAASYNVNADNCEQYQPQD